MPERSHRKCTHFFAHLVWAERRPTAVNIFASSREANSLENVVLPAPGKPMTRIFIPPFPECLFQLVESDRPILIGGLPE